MKTPAEILKDLMKERSITERELVTETDLTAKTVYKILNGHQNMEPRHAEEFAKAFPGVTAKDFKVKENMYKNFME